MITKPLKMNCRELKKISLLYLDKELSEADNSSAEVHLSGCKSCSAYIHEIEALYSKAPEILSEVKTDTYFYTRLKARMEADISYSLQRYPRISYYLKPAFYTLLAFTLLLSVVMISGSISNKQQTVAATTIQSTSTDEQDYLKTIAMNDQTFEEDYINMINK
jgi:predicted anti-sigma-YlaC factor YlaD